jgi:hypothetical protein
MKVRLFFYSSFGLQRQCDIARNGVADAYYVSDVRLGDLCHLAGAALSSFLTAARPLQARSHHHGRNAHFMLALVGQEAAQNALSGQCQSGRKIGLVASPVYGGLA